MLSTFKRLAKEVRVKSSLEDLIYYGSRNLVPVRQWLDAGARRIVEQHDGHPSCSFSIFWLGGVRSM
jgi:hypothetical protein